MRDKETGTWWQQITGKAISGPLKGLGARAGTERRVDAFGEWKAEVSDGKVLAPVAKYTKEYDPNWEPEVAKYPVPISFPGTALKSRDTVVGLQTDGPGRAYPWETLVKESPVVDRVNGTPLLIAVGPDGKSFRTFVSRVDGKDVEFFLKGEETGAAAKTDSSVATNAPVATDAAAPVKAAAPSDVAKLADAKLPETKSADTKPSDVKPSEGKGDAAATKTAPPAPPKPWILLDTTTGSEWNFQGCAISGSFSGQVPGSRSGTLKDYWFDWRNYNPQTTALQALRATQNPEQQQLQDQQQRAGVPAPHKLPLRASFTSFLHNLPSQQTGLPQANGFSSALGP